MKTNKCVSCGREGFFNYEVEEGERKRILPSYLQEGRMCIKCFAEFVEKKNDKK